MKISFIIPMYNVEEYIEECIYSILFQSINDFEIIIINDGSTDNSLKKVELIKDNRIKVITQKNKGLSAARNVGIKVAKGEYIAFVDSDDFILNKYAYEKMIQIAENEKSDIVHGKALLYINEAEKDKLFIEPTSVFRKTSISSEEYFLNALKQKKYTAAVWLNLYRRDILVKNKLMFTEGIFHEDEEFTPRVLLKAKKISLYKEPFYGYRQRVGSIMNNNINNNKKGNDIIFIIEKFINNIYEIKNESLRKQFINHLTIMLIDTIYKYNDLYIKKEIIEFLKKNIESKKLLTRLIMIELNRKLYLKLENINRKLR